MHCHRYSMLHKEKIDKYTAYCSLRTTLSIPQTLKVFFVSCMTIPATPTRLGHLDLSIEILAPWKSAFINCKFIFSQFGLLGPSGILANDSTPSTSRMYCNHNWFKGKRSEYFSWFLLPILPKPRRNLFLAEKKVPLSFCLCFGLILLNMKVWKATFQLINNYISMITLSFILCIIYYVPFVAHLE